MAVDELPRVLLRKFYRILYEIVDDPSLDPIISWSQSNKSFIVWKPQELVTRQIALRFACGRFTHVVDTFERNGLVRIEKNGHQWEFGHKEYLVRGRPELLKKLQREVDFKRVKKTFKQIK